MLLSPQVTRGDEEGDEKQVQGPPGCGKMAESPSFSKKGHPVCVNT